MRMATIAEFLDDLAADDDLQHEFELHPKRVMDQRGLDAEQQALILGGDLSELREAIEGETESSARVFLIKMRP